MTGGGRLARGRGRATLGAGRAAADARSSPRSACSSWPVGDTLARLDVVIAPLVWWLGLLLIVAPIGGATHRPGRGAARAAGPGAAGRPRPVRRQDPGCAVVVRDARRVPALGHARRHRGQRAPVHDQQHPAREPLLPGPGDRVRPAGAGRLLDLGGGHPGGRPRPGAADAGPVPAVRAGQRRQPAGQRRRPGLRRQPGVPVLRLPVRVRVTGVAAGGLHDVVHPAARGRHRRDPARQTRTGGRGAPRRAWHGPVIRWP